MVWKMDIVSCGTRLRESEEPLRLLLHCYHSLKHYRTMLLMFQPFQIHVAAKTGIDSLWPQCSTLCRNFTFQWLTWLSTWNLAIVTWKRTPRHHRTCSETSIDLHSQGVRDLDKELQKKTKAIQRYHYETHWLCWCETAGKTDTKKYDKDNKWRNCAVDAYQMATIWERWAKYC